MDYYITDYNKSGPDVVALEDSILKKGSLATAGSKILENFTAPFDATVVERLHKSSIVVAGKTRMAEFGISDDAYAICAVKDNAVSFCLCNDLFGHYRRQAVENCLCYIHPTYGTVSRYGLIPMACSMDQIGVLCKCLIDGFSLLSKIAGNDERDGAMFLEKNYRYDKTDKEIKLCVPSSVINKATEEAQNAIQDFSKNFTVVDGKLDYFDVYTQVMYILSCAEISSNLSRYNGIGFGYRSPDAGTIESLYTKTRTEAFGTEAKLKCIMGAFVLSDGMYAPYYEKAMKIRRLIKESLSFDKYDVIALPVSLESSALTALAGLPSVSFSYNGCGIQLIANAKNESTLLSAWVRRAQK